MTERRSADADLWELAPCGLVVVAGDGSFRRANTTFCRWLGYEAVELVGVKRLAQLMPMGARVFLQTHWTPLLQIQGSVSEVQLDLLHRDGRRIPMMLSAIRHERNGEVQDDIAVLIATDRKSYERELIAARSKAETALEELGFAQAQLSEANDALSLEHRRKDEFLATLAHELRNPLAPMANALETVRLKGLNTGHWEWAHNVLSRQVVQMTRLVDDLLSVSRLSQGKVPIQLKPICLAQALRLVAEEATPLIQLAGQRLLVDIREESLWINADQARITQIVANLLNNASKYSPEGACIALSAFIQAGEAVIEIRDNGIGIPPDDLQQIFRMFSQLTPALERSKGGLGIGLALVKGLVEMHGGTVAAHSDGPGKGSCFSVRLPLAQAAALAVAVDTGPASARPQGDAVAILIVDDNVDAADALAMGFELLGYAVRVANSANQALRIMATFTPRVAVLDIGLPDVNGYELARRIRTQSWGGGIALIAVTGWGQDTDKQKAKEAGFDIHFTKPIDFMKLEQEIKFLL
jgi:PAS domain S-box-containing protein